MGEVGGGGWRARWVRWGVGAGWVGEVGGGGWHARLVPTCQNFIDTSKNGQLFSLPDDARQP